MKYVNILIIILISSILLGATGCFNTEEKIVGRGIKLAFVETPGNELYEDQPFNIKMKVSNYGLSDVQGYLCLTDTPSDTFGGIPSNDCQSVNLDPALQTEGDVKPAEQELFFPDSGSYVYTNLPLQLGSGLTMNTPLIATFSYKTKTIAVAEFCIKAADSISTDCKNKETITKIKQAQMPIEITKIEKVVYVTKDNQASIGLTVHMKKMEDGYIIDTQALNEGKTQLNPEVLFSISLVGVNLKCSPLEHGNLARFSTGDEKVVQCIGTEQLSQDLIGDPLIITLEYGFKKTSNVGPIELKKEVI